MGHSFRFPRTIGLILAALIAAGALAGVIAGCGGDDKKNPVTPDGGTQTTTFTGAFTNGSESGKITVVINGTSLAGRFRAAGALRPTNAASLTASGTLRFAGGSTTALSGTYDTATDSLNLSGGGYILHGEYDDTAPPASVGGYYTGPGAAGTFGGFAGSSAIEVYLGTFQSDSTAVTGVLNMARADTLAGAIACPQGGEPIFLEGTATGTGTLKALALSNSEPGLFEVTATGTLNTTTGAVSGVWHTWDAGEPKGDDGTWSGTLSP